MTGGLDTRVDTVVVGAGLSGLVAARDLQRGGRAVVVLESADRVGGRAQAVTTSLGSRLDLGGQWVGHDHHRLRALCAELGLTVYPMRTPRLPVFLREGRARPVLDPAVLRAGLTLLRWEWESRRGPARPVPAGSVRQWLEARVHSAEARRVLEVLLTSSLCCDPATYPTASLLATLRAEGGLRRMMSTSGGAQEGLVVEAAGGVVERLAAHLGDAVRTGEQVLAVRQDDDGVAVVTATGTWHARHVIVTVPPPMRADLEVEPPLPPEHVRAATDSEMGTVYKSIAVYPRPFWQERHAEAVVLDRPAAAVFDTSPPDGPGHLCLLVAGPEARDLDALDVAARRRLLLGRLVPRLGPAVTAPREWHERAWHLDEHVGGGYGALVRPGRPDPGLPFPATPVGRMHWAGTETAREHPGYLEGAIEAGVRAAGEVLARGD